MFSGLVEEIGKVKQIEQEQHTARLWITCEKVLVGTKIGDSIAVNGVCLTVTTLDNSSFMVVAMPETMKSTNLSALVIGTPVNLERAVAAGERLGGHFVQGHIDGTAVLKKRLIDENSVFFLFQASPELCYYMINKGSISVNGVSLTIIKVDENTFSVSLIPHSFQHTTFSSLKVGDEVNIECDLIGKYLAKWLPTLPRLQS